MGDAAETVDLPTPAILKVDEISAANNIVPVLSFAHFVGCTKDEEIVNADEDHSCGVLMMVW
jgi:ATP adenylyltransferase/5',5'''-P-1,P-4-tetraphosphate phosphorylase II